MKPLQSNLQRRMLQVHAVILRCANYIAAPFRKMWDVNTASFEPKLRVVRGVVKGEDSV